MGQPSNEQPRRRILRRDAMGIPSDVFGSYTGIPVDPEELPVQDADDL